MSREKQLIAQRDEINKELGEIIDARVAEENKSKVGKCFAYRDNKFSCEGETWNVFYRVTGYDEQEDHLSVQRVEIDCNGKVEVETQGWLMSGLEECDQQEFINAVYRAQSIISDVLLWNAPPCTNTTDTEKR